MQSPLSSPVRAPRRTRRGLLLAALLVLGASILLAVMLRAGEQVERARPAVAATPAPVQVTPSGPPTPVTVTVDQQHPGAPVPERYLGLSFEVSALPEIARMGDRGNLVAMLRSLGPGVLRFGGISADTRTAWVDARTPKPAWASTVVEAGDLQRLRAVAQQSGWTVLLTVGLAHYDPAAAAREIVAARAALGPWLRGVEVGNEADAYAHHGLRRPAIWGHRAYQREVRAYMAAIRRAAGPIALAAPGVSGSHAFARWAPGVAAALSPVLLTGHHYPLGCKQTPAPSIQRLLSPSVRAAEERSLQRYLSISRATGIPFRMDELNSVSCGGTEGISNVFASALWATGYIGRALSAGVTGLNFEGNPAWCRGYSALCAPTIAQLRSGALHAQPLWYALLLARGLTGQRPVSVHSAASSSDDVSLSAFRAPDGSLTVLAVNAAAPGSPTARLALRVGSGYTSAGVTRLTGPAPEAGSGIALGGRTVGASGTLGGNPAVEAATAPAGVPTVEVPADSAALITLPHTP